MKAPEIWSSWASGPATRRRQVRWRAEGFKAAGDLGCEGSDGGILADQMSFGFGYQNSSRAASRVRIHVVVMDSFRGWIVGDEPALFSSDQFGLM